MTDTGMAINRPKPVLMIAFGDAAGDGARRAVARSRHALDRVEDAHYRAEGAPTKARSIRLFCKERHSLVVSSRAAPVGSSAPGDGPKASRASPASSSCMAASPRRCPPEVAEPPSTWAFAAAWISPLARAAFPLAANALLLVARLVEGDDRSTITSRDATDMISITTTRSRGQTGPVAPDVAQVIHGFACASLAPCG